MTPIRWETTDQMELNWVNDFCLSRDPFKAKRGWEQLQVPHVYLTLFSFTMYTSVHLYMYVRTPFTSGRPFEKWLGSQVSPVHNSILSISLTRFVSTYLPPMGRTDPSVNLGGYHLNTRDGFNRLSSTPLRLLLFFFSRSSKGSWIRAWPKEFNHSYRDSSLRELLTIPSGSEYPCVFLSVDSSDLEIFQNWIPWYMTDIDHRELASHWIGRTISWFGLSGSSDTFQRVSVDLERAKKTDLSQSPVLLVLEQVFVGCFHPLHPTCHLHF